MFKNLNLSLTSKNQAKVQSTLKNFCQKILQKIHRSKSNKTLNLLKTKSSLYLRLFPGVFLDLLFQNDIYNIYIYKYKNKKYNYCLFLGINTYNPRVCARARRGL